MKRTWLALLLSLLALPASAQGLTANSLGQVQMPPQSVLGNGLPTTGPVNAISYAQLSAQLFGATLSGPACPTGLITFQPFTNTALGPTGTTLNIWDGAQCVQWATLNQTSHLISGVFGGTITSGVNGTIGGQVTINGVTSGSRAIAVNPTATAFTFGGGALTVPEGGTGQSTSTAGTVLAGTGSNVAAFTATPTLGQNGGTGGSINLVGATSGNAIITVGATGGITNITGGVAAGGTVSSGGGGVNGSFTAFGATSGSWSAFASATGVPTMTTPWPVAAGGTGDTGTAWTTYTLSPSCGTATFSNVAATSKTIGKTTFAQFTFTISAVGTCAGNLTVSLPNTTSGAASLTGQESVNTGIGVNCAAANGATTMTCVEQPYKGTVAGATATLTVNAWQVNDLVRVSGVYQNQ